MTKINANKAARLFKRYGPFCQKCYQLVLLFETFKKDRWEFHSQGYYKKNGNIVAMATVEHKIPKALGGTNHDSNLALYCYDCNHQGSFQVNKEVEKIKLIHKLQMGKCYTCQRNLAKIAATSKAIIKGYIKIREIGAFCDTSGHLLSAPHLVGDHMYCFKCKDKVQCESI